MNDGHAQLFSSLISEIKSYDGNDPILPWLRGIRKMKHSLPPDVLKQKLPRFLQKCVQAFKADRRYRNDVRYLQVCIRLMDFMGDPGELLKMMNSLKIGSKRSLYYQAYALYFEKRKKYAESDEMYQLGVKNLAVPADELQKAYEQFLIRMQCHKKRKEKMKELNSSFGCNYQAKGLGVREATITATNGVGEDEIAAELAESCSCSLSPDKSFFEIAEDPEVVQENSQCENNTSSSSVFSVSALETNAQIGACISSFAVKNGDTACSSDALTSSLIHEETKQMFNSVAFPQPKNFDPSKMPVFVSEDTIAVSEFVGSAIVGKPEIEDACHHGLVDPTINTKEVMDDIDRMFRKPLDIQVQSGRKRQESRAKENLVKPDRFEIFVDKSLEKGFPSSTEEKNKLSSVSVSKFIGGSIVVKHEAEHGLVDPIITTKEIKKPLDIQLGDKRESQNQVEEKSEKHEMLEIFEDEDLERVPWFPTDNNCTLSESVSHGEQTIMIHRFTEAALVDDSNPPEDAYHHGLVEPTFFTKEAMNDINLMFGESLEFKRPSTNRDRIEAPKKHSNQDTFEILVDDDAGCHGDTFNGDGFGNKSTFCKSVPDPKLGNLDTERKQGIIERENPSTDVLTIFVDEEEEEEEEIHGGNDHNKFAASRSESTLKLTSKVDTDVYGFIGTKIIVEPDTENVHHHGLVDPTINLKEAMNDINSMFRKPLDFDSLKKISREEHLGKKQQISGGFTILVDDDLVESASCPPKRSECGLFEPTVVTKEAMDDINDMFGRPLDF